MVKAKGFKPILNQRKQTDPFAFTFAFTTSNCDNYWLNIHFITSVPGPHEDDKLSIIELACFSSEKRKNSINWTGLNLDPSLETQVSYVK